MSELRAFALTDEVQLDELQGATTVVGANAHTLDIKAALVHGSGVIVTDREQVIMALRAHTLLREVAVPDGAEVTPLSLDADQPLTDSAPQVFIPQGPVGGVQPVAAVPEEEQDRPVVESAPSEPNPGELGVPGPDASIEAGEVPQSTDGEEPPVPKGAEKPASSDTPKSRSPRR